MSLKLNDSYLKDFISADELASMQSEVERAAGLVKNRSGEGSGFLGWLDLPVNYDREELSRIKAAAEKIKNSCDVFIVIGIGGSYLGARAAIEFVRSPRYNEIRKSTPDIYFAGCDLSSQGIKELLEICEGRDICINVISKSGKTTEPALAFRIFRELLNNKYGEEGAKERIFVTTDKAHGKLKELAVEKGYESFVVPDDIGGRYSVLTAVGLLPVAVSGCDIDEMLRGAADARAFYSETDINKNDCFKYAACRNLLYRAGKSIEIFAGYDSYISMLAEWWKQLYGESEGKDGKGIFPASVIFTTDLHSLGQFIQQGERKIFETVLNIKNQRDEIIIPDDPANLDELNFLSGKTVSFVNQTAFKATALAHVDGGVPNIVLELDGHSEYDFGYAVYFFELACAVSGYILGVNPFDQPGVEAYKNNMYALLGKPGAENDARRAELAGRI